MEIINLSKVYTWRSQVEERKKTLKDYDFKCKILNKRKPE